MKILLLLAAFILSACASAVPPAPTAIYVPVDCLPEECGRIIARYTATAAVVATQNANATATHVSALETDQAAVMQTQRAFSATLQAATVSALLLTQSYEQMQATQQPTHIAATEYASATARAAQTQTAAPRTQAVIDLQLTADTERVVGQVRADSVGELNRQLRNFIFIVVAGVLALFGLWALGGKIRAWLFKQKGDATYRDTPLGPATYRELPNGQIEIILLNPPPRALPSQSERPLLPDADRIPIQSGGQVVGSVAADWRLPNNPTLRDELKALLLASIAREGSGGIKIPRHNHIGYSAEGRKRLTDILLEAGLVTKSNDLGTQSGTYLTAGRTLYQLLQGIESGAVSIAPVEILTTVPRNGTEQDRTARTERERA